MTLHMTAAEIRQARGIKRTCQSDACGMKFYDLGRQDIACPICQAAFHPPIAVVAALPPKGRRYVRGNYGADKPMIAGTPADPPDNLPNASADAPPESPMDATAEITLEDLDDAENSDLEIVTTED